MGKIKEVRVTANYAWSPAKNYPIYIAAGTAAQQLDATFSSNASLGLFTIDITEPSLVAKSAGKVDVTNRFHKVVWGSTYPDSPQNNGVIVCGTDKGGIEIYNPDQIVNGEEDCLVLTTSKHTGPVRALDFNAFQKNLFASGASDSEIFIWDLKNPNNPMTPGKKTQPTSAISAVAWNRQVQHILASSSTLTSGPCCVVWDLRKNEPIIKVQDPAGRMQCSDIAWHPEVATQLVLASEDDHTPTVQLWDLRFATSPMKVLEKHKRGVVSVAWCSQDPDLLLTCGKDNQVYCWNPNSSPPEVVYELETHAQWCFDVQWCPRNPNIVSTGSFDGHISVHSMMGGGAVVEEETSVDKQRSAVAEAFGSDSFPAQQPKRDPIKKLSAPLKKPPKWMRKPCGANFSFGGKLVVFEDTPATDGQQQQIIRRNVTINQVMTEEELLVRSKQLREALRSNVQCSEYCQRKATNAKNEFDEDFWNFLKVNFGSEPRQQYLQLLGYNPAELKTKFNMMIGQKAVNGNLSAPMDSLALAGKGEPSDGNFSASISNSSSSNCLDAFEQIAAASDSSQKPDIAKPMLIPTTDNDLDSLISQALLIGDYNAAVDLCLHGGRMAEAIVVAIAGGPALLEKTQKQYFATSESKISRLLSAVVTKDWNDIVRSCDLSNWKEALASLLTYASPDDLVKYSDELGERLEEDAKTRVHACLCYICSGNINKLVTCYDKIQPADDMDTTQDLIEKLMILLHVVESRVPLGDAASDKLATYASTLAAQGQLSAAMEILPETCDKPSVLILRDRLFHSQGDAVAGRQPPLFPFQREGLQLGQRPSAQVQPRQQNRTIAYNQQPAFGHPTSMIQPNQHQQSAFTPASAMQDPTQGSLRNNPYASQAMQRNATFAQQGAPGNIFTPQPVASAPSFVHQSMQPPLSHPSSVPLRQQPYNPQTVHAPNVMQPQPPPPTAVPPSPTSGDRHQVGGWNDPPVLDPNRIPKKKKTAPAFPAVAPPTYFVPDTSAPLPSFNAPTYQSDVDKLPAQPSFMSRMASLMTPAPSRAGSGDELTVVADPTPKPFTPDNLHIMTPVQPAQLPPDPMHPAVPPPGQMQNPAMNNIAPPGAMIGVMNQQNPLQPPVSSQQSAMMQSMQQNVAPTPSVPTGASKDVPKAPIPAEHQTLQTQFDELIKKCLSQTNNAHLRRKLDECSRRLEFLYDKLRANTLSPSIISGLHQVAQSISSRDYATGLRYHTQIVSQSNFSEISAFMPGLKSIIQIAGQLKI